MGRERLRQRLPLAQQPCDLLLGRLALGGDHAYPLAIGVERRIAERRADLREPSLERADLALDLLHTPPQLAHLSARPRLGRLWRLSRRATAFERLRGSDGGGGGGGIERTHRG